MIRTLALIFAMSCLAQADDELRQPVRVSKTETVDFPAGGALIVKNSIGQLTIEGWDQPGVEITTVKSTRAEYVSAEREKPSSDLDRVRVTAERRGGDLVITTAFPRRRGFMGHFPPGRGRSFYLEYRIKAPRDARLVVEHNLGDVDVDGVTGDIRAAIRQGEIALHLPEGAQYAIDAKSRLGSVISDFPGSTQSRFFRLGHQFVEGSQAPHKLNLRVGFGDILILKTRRPPPPPLAQ
jgi:hypothetical protein